MNEEKRTILEMVADGKITEAQARELLEALGDGTAEPETDTQEPSAQEPARALTDEEYGRIYSEAYGREYEEKYEALMEKFGLGSEDFNREVKKLEERAQAAARRAVAQAGRPPLPTEPPAPPAPPAPPTPPAPTAGSWTAWLSGISEEIRQGLKDIGRDLGRDLDGAMDDVSEAVSDLQEALGDVVEEWQEELADEQEEMAGQVDDQEFTCCSLDFPVGSDPFERDLIRLEGGTERENGEFVYRGWAALNSIEELEISWPTGQVRVRPWDGDHVETVERCKKALGPGQHCLIAVTDSCKLKIQEYPKKQTSGGAWGLFGLPGKGLEVLIPQEQCGSIEKLKISCTSGSADVSGLSGEEFEINAVSGSVHIQSVSAESLDAGTVSGSLSIEGCSAEKLQAGSVSGSNRCEGFSCEKAELSTVSGTLNAHGNAEKFKISTVSGSACLTVDQCPEKLQMHSVSGSLKVKLPENGGFTVDYGSMSGGFDCEFPAQITVDSKKKKNGRAVYLNGQTRIDMHTTSGSMKVLKA